MSFVNRRNALVGWLVWNVAKRTLRRKARAAVANLDKRRPSVAKNVELDARRPSKPAIVAALATLGVGAWLARHYLEEQADDAADVAEDAVDGG